MAKPGVLGSLGSIGVGKVVAAIGLAAVGASIGVALLLPPAPVSASAVPPVPAQIALTAPGADLSRNEGPAAVKAPIADEPPLVDVASLPRVPTVRTAKAPSPIALASAEPPRPGAVLAEEIVLIDTARAALAKGDAAGALVVLEHWPAHDQGALAHEAAALRVDALVKQGDMAAATRVAQAFLAEHPKSPLAARMRSLVHLEGETSIP